jgi:hypothetical protein
LHVAETFSKVSPFFDAEEVSGSNPLSPTAESFLDKRKTVHKGKLRLSPGLLYISSTPTLRRYTRCLWHPAPLVGLQLEDHPQGVFSPSLVVYAKVLHYGSKDFVSPFAILARQLQHIQQLIVRTSRDEHLCAPIVAGQGAQGGAHRNGVQRHQVCYLHYWQLTTLSPAATWSGTLALESSGMLGQDGGAPPTIPVNVTYMT